MTCCQENKRQGNRSLAEKTVPLRLWWGKWGKKPLPGCQLPPFLSNSAVLHRARAQLHGNFSFTCGSACICGGGGPLAGDRGGFERTGVGVATPQEGHGGHWTQGQLSLGVIFAAWLKSPLGTERLLPRQVVAPLCPENGSVWWLICVRLTGRGAQGAGKTLALGLLAGACRGGICALTGWRGGISHPEVSGAGRAVPWSGTPCVSAKPGGRLPAPGRACELHVSVPTAPPGVQARGPS